MNFSPRVSDAMRSEILASVRSGVSMRQTALDFGVHHSTVQKFVRQAQGISQEASVQYLDKKVGGFHWRDALPAIKAVQKLRKESSWSQRAATIKIGDGSSPVGLLCLSDMHIGAIGTDYDRFIELTDLILTTPNLYVAILGDEVEWAVKLRGVAEVCAQVLDPALQLEFIESWIDEIAHKVVCATWSNHSTERSEGAIGTCPVKNILAKRVPYFSGIGHAEILVGDQQYNVAMSHKFQGVTQTDSTAGCKKYLRMEWPLGDAAIQGDCHRAGVSVYNEGMSHRVAISCGTLHVRSGFAERYFSLFTSTAFPVLAMWPDVKRMVPFFNVDQFVSTLGYSN